MALIFISPVQTSLLHSRQPVPHFHLNVMQSTQTKLPHFSLDLPQVQSDAITFDGSSIQHSGRKHVGVIPNLSFSHLAFLAVFHLENISRIKSLLTTSTAHQGGPSHCCLLPMFLHFVSQLIFLSLSQLSTVFFNITTRSYHFSLLNPAVTSNMQSKS